MYFDYYFSYEYLYYIILIYKLNLKKNYSIYRQQMLNIVFRLFVPSIALVPKYVHHTLLKTHNKS